MNFANDNVIAFACLTEILLTIAFPKIVIPAIIAAMSDGIKIAVKFPKLSNAILATMLALAVPDKIPHMSPITSFRTELTLSAFLTKEIACLLPLTFLAAMAVKCSMLLDATAKPIISDIIEIKIKTKMTITATKIAEPSRTSSLNKLNDKETDMAKIKIIIGHTQVFLFFVRFNFCFIYF